MSSKPASQLDIEYYLVTTDRWGDLETLFGASGAYAGVCGGEQLAPNLASRQVKGT